MEASVGAHRLSRKLNSLGHDARLMPAKYVRPYSKGQKNDFRDAEAITEAVQRPLYRRAPEAWNRQSLIPRSALTQHSLLIHKNRRGLSSPPFFLDSGK
jgi:transposase